MMQIIGNKITQTDTKSKAQINCIVMCHLPTEFEKKKPESTILSIYNSFYNLVKADNYLFATYLNHYKKKLEMKI